MERSLSDLDHEMECARAACAMRIEAATTHAERREWRSFLAELERGWKAERAQLKE